MAKESIFTFGGTVQAGEGLYISRRADDELLSLCRGGNFAYVLTPRQLGKSSLMVRTAEHLNGEGVRSVIIDLTQIGAMVKAEGWYLGLLTMIEEQLDLDTNVVKWWQERAHLGITQRLTLFFQEVLLKEVSAPVVIFVDEIDTTLSLDFTDDFFAAIRYFYNARARSKDFQRLSVVLIGAATPGDLIRDRQRTPFNVGQRVDLTDFTFDEALPLAAGFRLSDEQARQVLLWVLKWTNGHPCLTQRLCLAVADQGGSLWSEAEVDRTVAGTFFGARSKQDDNLRFVRDMLTKRIPASVNVSDLLSTYRDIRRGRPVLDDEQSLIKSHLKLSGVVRRENSALCVRNPIYAEVFDAKWTKEHLPINWTKRLLRAVAVLIVVFLVSLLPLSIYAFSRASEADRQRVEAEKQRQVAVRQTEIASEQRGIVEKLLHDAQDAKKNAERDRGIAEQAKRDAINQSKKAQSAAITEREARQQAERAITVVEEQRERLKVSCGAH